MFVGDEGWIRNMEDNWLIVSIGLATILLEIWMIFEAWQMFPKAKGVLEELAPEALPKNAGETVKTPAC